MAIYYVYSGAGGSNNGSSWANAFTTLTTAFATEVAGDTLYVAHDHSESSGAAVTFASSGTLPLPTKIVCVNRAGSVPPVAADRRTTAQVATTSNFAITFNGFTHYDGIIFTAGNSTGIANIAVGSGSVWTRFDNCSLRIGSTGAGDIQIGSLNSGQAVVFDNTTASFSGLAQSVDMQGGALTWRNTPSALIGTTVPSVLFQLAVARGGKIDCVGVDFSAAGSGKTLVGSSFAAAGAIECRFLDCKLNASVTRSEAPVGQGSVEVDFIRCGAAGVNYTVHSHRTAGLLIEETAIVRTGGASDGTTPISWKIATTANCNYSMPFECPPIAIWNDTTGSSVTATIEGIWGGGAVPNDDDIWLDVEYLGDASSPQGSFVNDGKADLLAAAAAQTTSSATWGGSTTKFKLNVSFTAQQKGLIYARVKCAKASSTFYIDPLITLS